MTADPAVSPGATCYPGCADRNAIHPHDFHETSISATLGDRQETQAHKGEEGTFTDSLEVAESAFRPLPGALCLYVVSLLSQNHWGTRAQDAQWGIWGSNLEKLTYGKTAQEGPWLTFPIVLHQMQVSCVHTLGRLC